MAIPRKARYARTRATAPISPYGTSKLMSEIMLHDAGKAHGLRFVILRYFNVAGADPKLRTGQSTPAATHLIKVACEAALGKRPKIDVYGTDYPTPDGTCIRDYIHVSDLARAHSAALGHLRRGGASATFNCGYGRGASVFEVIDAVRRASGVDFPVEIADRRAGDPAALVANVDRIRSVLDWRPLYQDLDNIVGACAGLGTPPARQARSRPGLTGRFPTFDLGYFLIYSKAVGKNAPAGPAS